VFADALARFLPEKVSADRLFTLVGREVATRRTGERYPVVSDRLGRDVFLAGQALPLLSPNDPDEAFWLRITIGSNQITSCDDYRSYLEAFPDGKFSVRANRLLGTAPCVTLPDAASREALEANARAEDANRRQALIANGVLAPSTGSTTHVSASSPSERETSNRAEGTDNTLHFELPPVAAYPSRALSREIEGSCQVQFNADARGKPNSIIANCSDEIFQLSAIQAIAQSRLTQKIVNGVAVERENLSSRIVFQLGYDRDN
ncbi:MAG: energy transducer TonB, partial [Pseudomonadota bacterium]